MAELYIQGAGVLDGVLGQSGSLKGLVMARARSAADKVDAKRLLALTANTLAYVRPLSTAIAQAGLMRTEKRVWTNKAHTRDATPTSLALVLAHDLLLTPRKRIATSPAWPPHAAMQRHASRLKAELVKVQVQEGKQSVQELRAGAASRRRAERIPRWVRVNGRRAAVSDVLATLQAEGWSLVDDGTALLPKKCVLCLLPAARFSYGKASPEKCLRALHTSLVCLPFIPVRRRSCWLMTYTGRE